MYEHLKKLFFLIPEESAHALALNALDWLPAKSQPIPCGKTIEVMGLEFANPVGLAAGLDKNGDHIHGLGRLGFGFLEIGTVTPKPQSGNPKPRLFRITQHEAILNRMGFNNKGVEHLAGRLQHRNYPGVLGINIGKNKSTANEKALEDYKLALEAVYPFADYVTVNISSPNTQGLRDLQEKNALGDLLAGIGEMRNHLTETHKCRVPVVVKLAPDAEDDALATMTETIVEAGMDGIIISNTTVSRPGLESHPLATEAGGLSGKPLKPLADHALKNVSEALSGRLALIAAGGIMSPEDARDKIRLGADLVQLYSGLIYRGPGLVRACIKTLCKD